MASDRSSKTLRWLSTALGLLAVSILPFLPFFTGKTLNAADTLKSIPFMQWSMDQLASGSIGQWIPYLFGGMPAFASLVTAPVNPIEVSLLVLGAKVLFDGYADPVLPHIFYLFILGLGTWLYARESRVSRPGSLLLAGLAMSLTTLVGLAGAGHTVKLWTLCQVPLVMYLLERVHREARWRHVLVAGFAVGLMLLSKHVQIAYYVLLGAGVHFFLKTLLDKARPAWPDRLAALGRQLASVCCGLLLAAVLFLPVLNYSDQSIRSGNTENVATGNYAAAYSYPPDDVFTWLVPAAKGFGGQNYWGGLEYTAFPLFMGAVPLVLVVLGLLSPGRRRMIPLLSAAALLFLLGLGEHSGALFQGLVDTLPFYAKFRAHMWAIAVSQILLVLAAVEGWRLLFPADETPHGGRFATYAGLACVLVSGVFLLAAQSISPGKDPMADGDSRFTERDRQQIESYFAGQGRSLAPAEFQQIKNSIRQERGGVLAGSLRKEAVVLLLLGGVLVLRGRSLVKEGQAAMLLLVLGVGDAWPEYNKTLDYTSRSGILAQLDPDPLVQHLQQLSRTDHFRVWPAGVYPYNQLVGWKLQSVLGYQGARLQVTDDLLNSGRSEGYGMDREIHPHVLDLLNVKYTVSRGMLPGHVLAGQLGDKLLLSRETAAERVGLPGRITVVTSQEEARQRILAPDFDARAEVVLEHDPGFRRNGEGTARLVSWGDDELRIAVDCTGPSVLQISEIHYSNGWKAWVDGAETGILRSNSGTRALLLSTAGSHDVILRFAPLDFQAGKWTSLATFLVMSLLLGWLVRRERRQETDGKGPRA